MERWSRVVRGMTAMGLTFSAGVGALGSLAALVSGFFLGGEAVADMFMMAAAAAAWAFPIGVAFGGVLAIAPGEGRFERLSIIRVAMMGAGAGLLLFGALALNAWQSWTVATGLANAAILTLMGGGSAALSLLLARRAGPALTRLNRHPNSARDSAGTLPARLVRRCSRT